MSGLCSLERNELASVAVKCDVWRERKREMMAKQPRLRQS